MTIKKTLRQSIKLTIALVLSFMIVPTSLTLNPVFAAQSIDNINCPEDDDDTEESELGVVCQQQRMWRQGIVDYDAVIECGTGTLSPEEADKMSANASMGSPVQAGIAAQPPGGVRDPKIGTGTSASNRLPAGGRMVSASVFSDTKGYKGNLSNKRELLYAELKGNNGSHAVAGPQSSWGTALGNLPPGAKIKISYKGKYVIAEKWDIGDGIYSYDNLGGQELERAIDLYTTTVRALGANAGGLTAVKVSPVDASTPTTLVGQPALPDPDNPGGDSAATPGASGTSPGTSGGVGGVSCCAKAAPGTPTGVGTAGSSGSAATGSNAAYANKYAPIAYEVGKKYHIPWEIVLAVSALESGWGRSQLTARYNNFFGIKAGSSWTGPTASFNTAEYTSSGGRYMIRDSFRAYGSPEESFDGYGSFLLNNSRYAPAFAYPNDMEKFIIEIRKAGYATDPNYPNLVLSTWRQMQGALGSKYGTEFTPSAQMVYDTPRPTGASTRDSSNIGGVGITGGNICAGVGAGASSFSLDGMSFPVIASKELIERGGWCYTNNTNCHHDYNAVDIMVPRGTIVVAMKGGQVVRANSSSGPSGRSSVTIKDPEGNIWFYTHGEPGSLKVTEGQSVKNGDQLMTVGGRGAADGTSPHLHLDRLPPPNQYRMPCASAACRSYPFADIQPEVKRLYEAMLKAPADPARADRTSLKRPTDPPELFTRGKGRTTDLNELG